jgi:hypothetical protein
LLAHVIPNGGLGWGLASHRQIVLTASAKLTGRGT